MKCPYCAYNFKILVSDSIEIPDFAPLICENCAEISVLIDRKDLRKIESEELDALKQSPAWRNMLRPAMDMIKRNKTARNAWND